MTVQLKEYLNKQLKKTIESGPNDDVVLSSRIRLARNLDSKPFPWRATNTVLENIWDNTRSVINRSQKLKNCEFFYLPEFSSLDCSLLIERHLTSYDHVMSKKPRGVIVSEDERTVIMVNEEDHLRIASIFPGLNLEAANKVIDSLDTMLAQEMGFAFSDEWGFLTACPTNAGTGMRASCLVHLAGLIMTDKIEPLLRELSKLRVVVRGLYGEHTEVLGDIFQITNGPTLGRTESEILKSIEQVVNGIINFENNARKELIDGKNRTLTEDKVYRAKAILSNARSISFTEAMSLLSKVKLGISLGLDIPWRHETIARLIVIIQPAHIQQLSQKELSMEEIDVLRAEIIRHRLKSN
jgi:protein arginine kinase